MFFAGVRAAACLCEKVTPTIGSCMFRSSHAYTHSACNQTGVRRWIKVVSPSQYVAVRITLWLQCVCILVQTCRFSLVCMPNAPLPPPYGCQIDPIHVTTSTETHGSQCRPHTIFDPVSKNARKSNSPPPRKISLNSRSLIRVPLSARPAIPS